MLHSLLGYLARVAIERMGVEGAAAPATVPSQSEGVVESSHESEATESFNGKGSGSQLSASMERSILECHHTRGREAMLHECHQPKEKKSEEGAWRREIKAERSGIAS